MYSFITKHIPKESKPHNILICWRSIKLLPARVGVLSHSVFHNPATLHFMCKKDTKLTTNTCSGGGEDHHHHHHHQTTKITHETSFDMAAILVLWLSVRILNCFLF